MTLTINNNYHNTPINIYESERLRLILNEVKKEDLAESIISSIIKQDQVAQLKRYYPTSEITENHYFSDGNTILHKAAQYNALNCVKYLVNLFSDINILSKYGSTPLENALINHADDTTHYLRELGAKAYITTLSELVTKSKDIIIEDKYLIGMAIEFSEGYGDVLTNIDDYITNLGLTVINEHKDNRLFFTSLGLLMVDHITKLERFKIFSQQNDQCHICALLNKYALTSQQSIIYRQVDKMINDSDKLISLCQDMLKINNTDMITWNQLESFKSLVKEYRIGRYSI